MRLVKKILIAAGCSALIAASLTTASPGRPHDPKTNRLARADLAEAVFAMVLENAKNAGMPLAEPITLCQACTAAHLGLPDAAIRRRCLRACGLQP